MAKSRRDRQNRTESPYSGDFTDIAFDYTSVWMTACDLQIRRILDRTNKDQMANLVDCAMLVLAFDSLSAALDRYAEFLGTSIGGKRVPPHYYRARRFVRNAGSLIYKAVPQLRAIRHAIAHFDAYAFGEGNNQRSSGRPAPMRLRHAHLGDNYVLVIHDTGHDQPLVFDMKLCNETLHEIGRLLVDAAVEIS